MRILVIGGNGFLGTAIGNDLRQQGHHVKSMARNFSPDLDFEQIIADIRKPDSYEDEISSWKPEIVVQCAWVTDQSTYRESPLNNQYMVDTLRLAEHCFQSETKHLLVLGSSAEYGVPKEPCNALTTPAVPRDYYGISKLRTLEQLTKIAERYSRRLSWARVFQPYGRNQDSARLIPHVATELRAGNQVSVKNPSTVLDWISSRDVASAVTFALHNMINPVFDIGTSVGTPVLEVLQKVAVVLDVDPRLLKLEQAPNSETDPFTLVVDRNSPLFLAGWRAKDDLQSGLVWTLSR